MLEALGADRVALHERDSIDPDLAITVAAAGAMQPVIPHRFGLIGGWVEAALTSAELVHIEELEPAPADAELRALGIEAAIIAPVCVADRVEVAISVHYRAARTFDEIDLVLMRGIAAQVEFALESRRLADADAVRGRRADSLERMMLALREPREPRDILAIVARGLAHDFRRPCVAYELRDGRFVAIVGSGTTGSRVPIALDRFEIELLVSGNVRRDGARDVAGITANDQLRALLVLEGARDMLTEDDTKYVRAVGTHAGLALSGALAFDQLRRYATEGAALKDAARTILGYTELRPLATALSRLAARLVSATSAEMYSVEGGELVLIGSATEAVTEESGERVEIPPDGTLALFERRFGDQAYAAVRLRMSDDDRAGYLVVRRARGVPFERFERRIVDALVNLAQLAIRNVDLYERSDRANRALAESNGFKDDLLAMFAHDFKGPLTVISGFSELLLEIAEDEEIRANVKTISDQTKRLAKLADDALALAATQSAGFSLQRELDDLGAFVAECCRVLDPDGARLVFETQARPVKLLFDRARLRHVIDNVVGNALKYSSGKIVVRVGRAGREAFVEVTDRGIGIPALEIATVFTRYGAGFERALARGLGVGRRPLHREEDRRRPLGDAHEVASVENEGSTFRIGLPA